MSDDDSDTPFESVFSKRVKFTPKKTPEELKAAEELVAKIEAEQNAQNEANLIGNETESGARPKTSDKKVRKKKFPSRPGATPRFGDSSQPCACSHSASSSHSDDSFYCTSASHSYSTSQSASCSQSASASQSATSSDPVDAMKEKMILEREIKNTPLSAAARKRLKKLREDQELDRVLIDAKNARILEGNPFQCDTTPDTPVIEEEKEIYLTINCMNKFARFKCLENENFIKVFKDVAEHYKLKPSEFLLCRCHRNIAVTDTPKSLNISKFDILECIPYKPEVTSESVHDENTIILSFQSNDEKFKIDMVVNKMENMQSIMEKYARKRSLPLNLLTFKFDGETLLGSETPAELDMETGHCIDVWVFMPMPQCSFASDDVLSDDTPSDKSIDDKPSDKDNYFDKYFQDFSFPVSDSDESDCVILD